MKRASSAVLAAAGLCACTEPAQEPVTLPVSHDGQNYEIKYFEDWPVYRIVVSGVGQEMHGGQLDTVRLLLAEHLDPKLCPEGHGFGTDPSRKVTPIFLPQVDYWAGVFYVNSSCAPK